MSLHAWLIYLVAAIGLSLTPGPNSLLVLTHGRWRSDGLSLRRCMLLGRGSCRLSNGDGRHRLRGLMGHHTLRLCRFNARGRRRLRRGRLVRLGSRVDLLPADDRRSDPFLDRRGSARALHRPLEAVDIRLLYRIRVALHGDSEAVQALDDVFTVHTKLFCELRDPNLAHSPSDSVAIRVATWEIESASRSCHVTNALPLKKHSSLHKASLSQPLYAQATHY